MAVSYPPQVLLYPHFNGPVPGPAQGVPSIGSVAGQVGPESGAMSGPLSRHAMAVHPHTPDGEQ